MIITLIATGSRGDVQPYVALAKGLHQAGHTVRFFTHQNFESLVVPHQLKFWPLEVDVQQIAQTEEMRQQVAGGNFLKLMSQMAKEAKRAAVLAAEGGVAACQGTDLILGGMGGVFNGLALAEKFNLPFLQAYLVPFSPTQEFPSVLVPGLPPFLSKIFNQPSHHLTRQMIWQGFRSADQLARKEVLGLPPAPYFGPYHSPHLDRMPTLYGFSPSVISHPQDWGKDIHITGYWFLDAEDHWTPPDELLNFLNAGPPPVYIGFGSMSNQRPKETTDLIVNALRQINQRGILLSGWGGLQTTELSDSVMMVDSIPHAWLFPRMAAVVHHGGAGTTAAGMRAGVPSLVVPFFGDQPFWGQRIAELGAGPSPIPRKKLTVDCLAQAIHQAVTDDRIRQNAAVLGARIQAEDGVAQAVEIISQFEERILNGA
ncbi:MAG TPA: glycosyltransferase [Anaerolineales bacterium]|nr:glycosyltransferase [Anaerolineales bacterium]